MIWVGLGIWVTLILGLVWLVWYQPTPQVTVQSPEPVVVPAPVVNVVPQARQRRTRVEIRLVSGSGRELGACVLEDEKRPAVLSHRTVDGLLGNFVAAYQDGSQWVYRRVGVEREDRNPAFDGRGTGGGTPAGVAGGVSG